MELRIFKHDDVIDLSALKSILAEYPNGEYKIKLSRVCKGRTLPQNAYLWGVVYPILIQGYKQTGIDVCEANIQTPDLMHEYLKDQICDKDYVNYETGEIVRIPRDTSMMNINEFTTYLQELNKIANELDIVIPPPDKNWKINNNK